MAGSREGSKPITLIEALEDYSAHHPESVVELSKWPARRFRRFYALHQKRQIITSLDAQRKQMVAALWSNPNWDDTKDNKGARKRVIDSITEDYDEAIEAVEAAFSNRVVPDEEKLSDNNPFFAAADRGLAKVDAKIKQLKELDQEIEAQEPPDYMKDLDQA